MAHLVKRYAQLLTHYCLELKKGETLLITSPYLAEPLLQELYQAALETGAHPFLLTGIDDTERLLLTYGNEDQLKTVNPFFKQGIENFDAFLNIRAPFNLHDLQNVDPEKQNIRQQANKPVMQTYFKRLGSGDLKRSLCQWPTIAAAQEAGMSLKEYESFVFNACYLYDEDPEARWLEVRDFQQGIKEHLDSCTEFRYKSADTDLSFTTKGRTWINSDGRNNMPSGEVFTSPEEDSVNGHIRFTYPAVYMGHEVEDVELTVENGKVVKWDARHGKDFLDQIFRIAGARYFGEAAIGTNKQVRQFTKNILFDEKIGGTVHMAIGQSYLQAGGKNESSVHWDMICDMREGGEIYADGEKIYENGAFLI